MLSVASFKSPAEACACCWCLWSWADNHNAVKRTKTIKANFFTRSPLPVFQNTRFIEGWFHCAKSALPWQTHSESRSGSISTKLTHYRVSASSDSLANRGLQPRTSVLGERSESADVHRGSDEPESQAVGLFRPQLAHYSG